MDEWNPPPPRRQRATSLYRRLYGATLRELAAHYHRSISTVWGWLKRGWTPKPPGGT